MRALIHADPDTRPGAVVAVLLDQTESVRLLHTRDGGTVPAYADPQSTARALAHAATRTRLLARRPGTVPERPEVNTAAAEAVVARYLAEHPEGGGPDPQTTAELLAHYAIPQSPWAWARDEDEAVRAAERLAGPGGRVVMKAYWPGLVHKSDQGAVRLDLQGADQVRAAHRDLADRFGDRMTGVVVQPMAARGTELVAGVVQDEVFGPLVLFGLGGTATELLADHAARLAPLTDTDVRDLLTAPRCAPLLFGYRGGGPVDMEGLERLLLGLYRMAGDLTQLEKADLNPVVARPDGVTALDARLRLLPRPARDPYLRRLR
ncbi:hypothetical protein SSP24_03490 [Streptomyces spinoverrucosus]|uniref:ATP-grasp domain-containing protein n=1 Tax=Streptomyces spinoverrucosus TaxID=284043 RepID=A0A4Y3V793_9ACTN|nr:hypothetical protein SSP24_03490 [Streptomyces spinoverrucosus]GHB41163.1 hypothetical protein GCM10010397_09110 [Streptomyces spinoverrucosus]